MQTPIKPKLRNEKCICKLSEALHVSTIVQILNNHDILPEDAYIVFKKGFGKLIIEYEDPHYATKMSKYKLELVAYIKFLESEYAKVKQELEEL